MELFITLAANILYGYSSATIFFLIASLCYSPLRQLKSTYLYISNMIAMVIAALLGMAVIWHTLSTPYRPFDYIYFRYPIAHLLLRIVFVCILPLLFLYGKYRTSIPVTLLVIVFQYMGSYYALLLYFVTSFFRDYLPSSWAYYRSPYVEIICWPLAYLFVILVLAKIRMTATIKQQA